MAEGLFVATNLLEACRGWQEVIELEQDFDAKDAAGYEALSTLMSSRDYLGCNRVIVKGKSAFMVDNGMSQEETVWPVLEFDAMTVIGSLGWVQYIRKGRTASLAWMLCDVSTIDAPTEVMLVDDDSNEPEFGYFLPVNKPIRRPLYFPVGQIDYALPAA